GGQQAGDKLVALLKRAWLLGPKRIGPNILLAPPPPPLQAAPPPSPSHPPHPSPSPSSPTAAAAPSALPAAPSPSPAPPQESLFDVPPNLVVRAAKVTSKAAAPGAPGGMAAAAAAAAAAATADVRPSDDGADGGSGGDATANTAAAASARLDLRLGRPEAALALGLITQEEAALYERYDSAASGGTTGEGAADVNGGALSLLPCSSSTTLPSASASSSLPDSLRHVVASVESGVVAGFQIAASSGPLCEEPLWGVAFELEVRLVLAAGGGAAGAAGGAGSSSAGEASTAASEGQQ
ncbi:hypothetical protein Agub_g4102, partial [Astrephomene gubernaculifera]